MEKDLAISFEHISTNCKTIGEIVSLTENYLQNALKCEIEPNLEGLQ